MDHISDPKNAARGQPVDFNGLILGFSSAALYYLGHETIAGRGVGERNLDLAQQNIEILALLRQKTSGNLSTDENRLLDEILHDLHTKYARAREESR